MIENSQDATLGRGRSQSAAVDAVEQVEADPGAVFEAHGATSVDDLVAGDDEAAADAPDDCTADDVAVAAMFDGDLEAPDPDPESAAVDAARTDDRSDARSDEVLVELDAAIPADDETTGSPDGPEPSAPAPDDPEVADALAAAADVDDRDLAGDDVALDDVPLFD